MCNSPNQGMNQGEFKPWQQFEGTSLSRMNFLMNLRQDDDLVDLIDLDGLLETDWVNLRDDAELASMLLDAPTGEIINLNSDSCR